MKAPDAIESAHAEDLQLLIFTLMGTRLGVDTAQVDGMIRPDEAEDTGVDPSMFHERVPFREGRVVYNSPMVLMIKDQEKPRGIIIEEPDEIISVSLDCVRPLPPLIGLSEKTKAIWGVAVKDADVIVLVDFCKMSF